MKSIYCPSKLTYYKLTDMSIIKTEMNSNELHFALNSFCRKYDWNIDEFILYVKSKRIIITKELK